MVGDLRITVQPENVHKYNAHADALTGYPEPNTNQTLTINRSPEKILLCFVGFLLFAAMCFHLARQEGAGFWYVASTFCVLLACWSATLAFGGAKSRITLTPDGFHSESWTPNFIPWASVESISRSRVGGYKVLDVRIAKQIWSGVSSRDRFMLSMNRAIGVHGLPISNSLLGIKFDRLEALFQAYARANGGKID